MKPSPDGAAGLARASSGPKRLVLLLAALAAAALGCSGPNEYTTPLLEPEGTAAPPRDAAQPDTACLPEGSEIAGGADAGASAACCEGLTRSPVYKGSILRLDECEAEADGHAFCIRCGDGRCGVGENTCSCAADCHWP